MSWQSFPARTPSFLSKHPLLLASWLALHNRMRRAGGTRLFAIAVLVVVGVVAALIAVIAGSRDPLPQWIERLGGYWVLIFGLAMLHAASITARRRRKACKEWPDSWLGAAPLPPESIELTRWIHACWPVCVQWAAACCVLLGMATIENDWRAVLKPMVGLTLGTIAGSIIGGW